MIQGPIGAVVPSWHLCMGDTCAATDCESFIFKITCAACSVVRGHMPFFVLPFRFDRDLRTLAFEITFVL